MRCFFVASLQADSTIFYDVCTLPIVANSYKVFPRGCLRSAELIVCFYKNVINVLCETISKWSNTSYVDYNQTFITCGFFCKVRKAWFINWCNKNKGLVLVQSCVQASGPCRSTFIFYAEDTQIG